MAAIRVEGLEKSYGSVDAVDGMRFAVERGELFGFLGPNGAGKTTTIRALTGQIVPDAGTVEVLGTDPTESPLETRGLVGILPEQGSPPSFLTPTEYLRFVGEVRGLEPSTVEERTATWAERLGFERTLETLHADLSRGQQQKVMIAQAFLHEPEVVFIDEPLANLDPLVQERVKRFLVAYAAEGNAVFASTHNIDVAESICTRVGIVADGRIVAERTLARDVDESADGATESDDRGDSAGRNESTEPLLETFLERVSEAEARDLPSIGSGRA
ncbi:ABC transporter ATP-binding protein [Natrialbaceae archaeon GCM10025810]|uniref:ABC transporter ATP-binding protein n=1 Tax=Halovalidus salilacus TaxID=3075124 RepID=UPI003619BD72